jgi:hypothetical protein
MTGLQETCQVCEWSFPIMYYKDNHHDPIIFTGRDFVCVDCLIYCSFLPNNNFEVRINKI